MQLLLEIVLVGVFFVAFLSALSLTIKEWGDVNKRIFAILYFVLGFVFLADYLYLKHFLVFSVAFRSLHMSLVFSVFPLLYFYVKRRVEGELELKDIFLHLLFPFLFVVFSSVLYYGFFSSQERLHWLQKVEGSFEHKKTYELLLISRYIYVSIIIVQILYYNFSACLQVRRYTHLMDVNSCENVFRFNKNVIGLIMVISFGVLLFYISNISFNSPKNVILFMPIWLLILGLVVLLLLWFLFIELLHEGEDSYFVQKNTSINAEANKEMDTEESLLFDKLVHYMDKKSTFLNAELIISDVCMAVGSNRTYVSRMFNKRLGTNFKTYINDKRIDYAEELLQHSNIEIADLYINCGFKSVSSFYKAFNTRLKTSPLKYRKTLEEKQGIVVSENII